MRLTCVGCVLALLLAGNLSAQPFTGTWPKDVQRTWVGPDYWASPLQDWRIAGGRAECIGSGGDRQIFLLTREVRPGDGSVSMTVRVSLLSEKPTMGWAGFNVGIQGENSDYRNAAIYGKGTAVGITTDGRLFAGRFNDASPRVPGKIDNIELRLSATTTGRKCPLKLEALDSQGRVLATMTRNDWNPDWLAGGISLVSSSTAVTAGDDGYRRFLVNPRGRGRARGGNVRFAFADWRISGTSIVAHDDRAWGPVLFCQYTIAKGVLKLSAQLPPMGEPGWLPEARLEVKRGDQWQKVASARMEPMSRTVLFRVTGWDSSADVPYRVVCPVRSGAGQPEGTFAGLIRHDPVEKQHIVAAAFTCQWDVGYPHASVAAGAASFNPDLNLFTGDQIYEPNAGYGIQRAPLDKAVLDYLRKWYLYGWAFGDLLKDRPTICMGDDHDVYHGNLWGAGGRHAAPPGMKGQDEGGYTQPAAFVNVVMRTQSSHLPDSPDPTPVDQGIVVCYGSMNWGGVGFAILEDRKWKSAPAVVLPDAKIVNGWSQNPAYNAARDGDVPGAQLLGERQMKFLNEWVADWSGGVWMKAVVSETIFANVATLPATATSDNVTPSLPVPKPGEYPEGEKLVADHDCDSWPQTPRNNALRVMRKAFAIQIAGDQHLASTIQYGVDDFHDAAWAICVPAISNLWPRRFFPPEPGAHHVPGMPRYTGDFIDGFGNRMSVAAVANPVHLGPDSTLLQDRVTGYGIVEFDRKTRKITMTCWPRWVDPTQPGAKPYAGWPITIDQMDNYGRKPTGFLPTLHVEGMQDAVVQLIDESTGELVYALRINGDRFRAKVFKPGAYTLRVGDPDRGIWKELHGLKIGDGEATVELK